MALALLFLPLQAGAQSAASPQWSTYIGGADRDRVTAISQNPGWSIAVVGRTLSIDFATPPTEGAQTFSQIFLAGFDKEGDALPEYPLRMFGGTGADEATAVVMAPDGAVYIVGQTNSPSMTGAGDEEEEPKGGNDAFLIRFDIHGNPDWYMYLGGLKDDAATGVALIGSSVYVCGLTNSNDFQNSSPPGNPAPDSMNAFVVRVDVNSPTPVVRWARLIGGSGIDRFFGITAGPTGMVLAAGTTNSLTADLGNRYGSTLKNEFKGGESDAFVVALNTDSGEPLWMTYVGGDKKDEGKGIAAGINNTFVVAGNTTSTNIAGNMTPAGTNVFGAWMTAEGGMRLIQLRGGAGEEEVLAVTTDTSGTAYIGGRTGSSSFPRVSMGFDTQIEPESPQPPPHREGFVWMFPGWGGPGWDSFAGGPQMDEVTGLAAQLSTQLIVGMGTASSTGLPGNTTGRDPALNGPMDGYLLAVKVNDPQLPNPGQIYDRPKDDAELEDIETTTSTDSIFASWTEFTYSTGGAIPSNYEWAIGTPENPTGIRNFAPTDMPLRSKATGLNLEVGKRYIVTVRAPNLVGLTQGAQSDGVVVTLPDGGMGEPDAGMGEPDAGMVKPDAGTVKPDGGMDEPDGGSGDGDEKDGDKVSPLGWGCSSAGGMALPLFLGLIAFLILSRRLGEPSR